MRALPLVLALVPVCLPQLSLGQELTLPDALKMAKENNGTVIAAMLQYESSKAAARAAYASFLPSVIPTFTYETSRTENFSGPFRGLFRDNVSDSSLSASWRVLDSGERNANYRRSAISRDITGQNA